MNSGRRKLQERYLPSPPPVGIAIEVELVHNDLVDLGIGAGAQRHVRDDLSCRADNGSRRVYRGVTGQHADVLSSEVVAKSKELLRDERLDRSGVEGSQTARQGCYVRSERYQALARTGGRVHDHVRAGEHLQERLFLGGVKREPALGCPGDERRESVVAAAGDRSKVEARGHVPSTLHHFRHLERRVVVRAGSTLFVGALIHGGGTSRPVALGGAPAPTRAASTALCRAGHVKVNETTAKPSTTVHPGDTVTARVGDRQRVLEVVKVIDKRVGAPIAAQCVIDHSPPPPPREVRPLGLVRDPSSGRPTKKDRREIDRLRGR